MRGGGEPREAWGQHLIPIGEATACVVGLLLFCGACVSLLGFPSPLSGPI